MAKEKCCHYWCLEANKIVAKGQCEYCGEVRLFNPERNSVRILSRKVLLSVDGACELVPFHVLPRTTLRDLLKKFGFTNKGHLLKDGRKFRKADSLFEAVETGDVLRLVEEARVKD